MLTRMAGGQLMRTADMSVPAEDRRRKRKKGPKADTPPAQLSHARSAKARKWARKGEKKMRRGRA